MNSSEMKAKVLHYLRFKRRFLFVATEAGTFNSDVLASNGYEIVEVEVKISKQDLKNEFKKKKHRVYANPTPWYKNLLPNRFFFAVPECLVDDAKELCKGTKYGVMVVYEGRISHKRKKAFVRIVKQAKQITEVHNKKLRYQLVLRMSSEIVRKTIQLTR